MSYEIGDEILSDGVSHCCFTSVIDPSGEGIEGFCGDCHDHCSVVYEDDEV